MSYFFTPYCRFYVGRSLDVVDFDINQAYLIGKADPDQQYPVRLSAGPIRDKYKQADGSETYALIQGNLYGLPTA